MRLYLIRHGKTDHNDKKIMQGHTDTFLSDEGIVQAQKLAQRLADHQLHAIYTSDLSRAKHTAEHIVQYHPTVPFVVDTLLRERDRWQLTGKTKDEVLQLSPTNFFDNEHYYQYNIETDQSVQQRIQTVLDKLKQQHRWQNVVIVSHGGWLRMLRSMIENTKLEALFGLHNASITIYHFHENWYTKECDNDADHLA